jgi:hypothetical protein
MVYSWDYDFSSPNWTAEWSARAFDIRWQVSPPPEGFFFSEGVADPEDAIGIQYEGRPWDPADPWSHDVDTNLGPEFIVGATLGTGSFTDQTELRGDFEDDSGQIDGYAADDLTQTSITHIMAEGATLETVATVEVDPSPGAKVVGLPAPGVFDLTDVLEANGWACQLYCQTPLIPPRRPPDTVPISFGNVRYGVKLQVVQIKWQVRALRYRWVYATTPYRRIYPRDDGLGGGAPRTYPPSKSVQLGNRTTGGYL